MEAITSVLTELGATVTKDSWDAQSPLELQEEHVDAMRERGTSISMLLNTWSPKFSSMAWSAHPPL